jgi:SAM-dependent methyltransferase
MKDDPFDPNARLAGEFDRWVEDGRAARLEAGHSVIADAVIARMPIRGRSSVLDLSCGTGWATRRLAGRAHHGRVWGVDVSPAMIRIARNDPRNPPHVDFEVAPAEALPFPADTFDAVFSMEAFYYFPDVPAALAECRRVLKPSGELDVVIHLFWENELSRRWPELLEVPVTLLPAADWVKMCQAVGFSAAFEERVPDSTPVRDEEAPSKFFRTPQELRKFREQGALRVVAVK